MQHGLQIGDGKGNIQLDLTSRMVNIVGSFTINAYITGQRGWGDAFSSDTPATVQGTFTHSALTMGKPVFIPLEKGGAVNEFRNNGVRIINMRTNVDVTNNSNLWYERSPQRPDFIVSGNTVTWSFNMQKSAFTADYGDFLVGGFEVYFGFF